MYRSSIYLFTLLDFLAVDLAYFALCTPLTYMILQYYHFYQTLRGMFNLYLSTSSCAHSNCLHLRQVPMSMEERKKPTQFILVDSTQMVTFNCHLVCWSLSAHTLLIHLPIAHIFHWRFGNDFWARYNEFMFSCAHRIDFVLSAMTTIFNLHYVN